MPLRKRRNRSSPFKPDATIGAFGAEGTRSEASEASGEISRRSERFLGLKESSLQNRLARRSRRNGRGSLSSRLERFSLPTHDNLFPRDLAQLEDRSLTLPARLSQRAAPGPNTRAGFQTTFVRLEPGRFAAPLEPKGIRFVNRKEALR